MTPEQFLSKVREQQLSPVYLFLGPEGYRRTACRKALLEAVLPPNDRERGYTRHDLTEVNLREVIDDAISLSLFAQDRLIWVSSAEAALPRGRAASEEEDGGGGGGYESVEQYCANPTPGTVLVFDCTRYGLDGEDKARSERVRKFYAAVREVVEFAPLEHADAMSFASRLAMERKLRFAPGVLEHLAETTAGDAGRLASEIEKLSLYFGPEGGLATADVVYALAPDAAQATIFALVDALAHRDRGDALLLLDRLLREGQYVPLALTFLGGIFRQALITQENRLRSSREIVNYFRTLGIPMWASRAEQVLAAASRFSPAKLKAGLELTFEADRSLKGTRPDDRLVIEDFVFKLTQPA